MRWRSCLGTDISDLWDVKNSEKGGFAPTGAGRFLSGRRLENLFCAILLY